MTTSEINNTTNYIKLCEANVKFAEFIEDCIKSNDYSNISGLELPKLIQEIIGISALEEKVIKYKDDCKKEILDCYIELKQNQK